MKYMCNAFIPYDKVLKLRKKLRKITARFALPLIIFGLIVSLIDKFINVFSIVLYVSIWCFSIGVFVFLIVSIVSLLSGRSTESQIEEYKKNYYIIFNDKSMFVSIPMCWGTFERDSFVYEDIGSMSLAKYEFKYKDIEKVSLEERKFKRKGRRSGSKSTYKVCMVVITLKNSNKFYYIYPALFEREFMATLAEKLEDKMNYEISLEDLDKLYGKYWVYPVWR